MDAAMAPERAFELLGHRVRLDVLEAVVEAPGERVPFSEIHERVDVRDSGRLNYHLTELRPHFLTRTDDGYRVERPGHSALRMLRAGTVTGEADLDPVELSDCVRCGGTLELHYDDQFAVVACPDCDNWFVRWGFPPGGLDEHSGTDVARALDRRCRSMRTLANGGVCPLCVGRIDARLAPDDQYGHSVAVRYECDRCHAGFGSTLGAALVARPEIVAFCHERGLDVRERPLWELEFAFDPDAVAGDSEGATLTVSLDGDERMFEVGPDLSVR